MGFVRVQKRFLQVLQRHKIDVMALQEVRAFPDNFLIKCLILEAGTLISRRQSDQA